MTTERYIGYRACQRLSKAQAAGEKIGEALRRDMLPGHNTDASHIGTLEGLLYVSLMCIGVMGFWAWAMLIAA